MGRYTDDIALALQTGERWREDIRHATAPPHDVRIENSAPQALHIPQGTNEVIYLFLEGAVYRQAHTNAPWSRLLGDVKDSRMTNDQRPQVAAWRWELELKTRSKNARVQPLFSFEATAAPSPTP